MTEPTVEDPMTTGSQIPATPTCFNDTLTDARLSALRELISLEDTLSRLTVRAHMAAVHVENARLRDSSSHLVIESVEGKLRELREWVGAERDVMVRAYTKALRDPEARS